MARALLPRLRHGARLSQQVVCQAAHQGCDGAVGASAGFEGPIPSLVKVNYLPARGALMKTPHSGGWPLACSPLLVATSGAVRSRDLPNKVPVQFSVSGLHSSARLGRGMPQQSDPEGDSEAEQRSPPTERVRRLAEEIAELTLLEVADLTTLLKRKLGLPDSPFMGGMPMMPMGGMMPGAGAPAPGAEAAAAEPAKVEKTSFDVKLEKFDAAAKLKIIKEVRAITGLGLKESKELVESAPAVLKKGVTKDEAESIMEKLKAVGAEMALE